VHFQGAVEQQQRQAQRVLGAVPGQVLLLQVAHQ
jgi:hypothetical protein